MPRLELDIFMEGTDTPIGRLESSHERALTFRYTDPPEATIPLSLSMPIREAPYSDTACRAFFSNLLFENEQLSQTSELYGIDRDDVVGLLYHLGEDCPGSLSCIPVGNGPGKTPGDLTTDYEPVDEAQLISIMNSLRDHRRLPNGTNDPSPIAGVQGKVALTRLSDGQFAFPKPDKNVPTTHLLKVPHQQDLRLVDHEKRLLDLAGEVQKHTVVRTEIIEFGDTRGLLIERYDRKVDENRVHRLHQEDFCQALGLASTLKYERNGIDPNRTFTAKKIGEVLDQTNIPGIARQAFLNATLINLIVGNTDNHAKNHSLLYHTAEPELSPLYDIVPIILDPQVTHDFSFNMGRAQCIEDLTRDDLAAFISDIGFKRMSALVEDSIRNLLQSLAQQIDHLNGPAHKALGDMMASQLTLVSEKLEFDLEIPERDLFVRQT